MRKGFEWSISLLVAIILFVVSVGIFWAALNPSSANSSTDSQPKEKETVCKTDDNCINNPDGAKCLVIYPGDVFTPFCGCLTNDDCRVGDVCGSDNKCI